MCNDYEELISRGIDHELTKEEEEQLVAHLKTCEMCQKEYGKLLQLKKWLNNLEEEPLPKQFHQDLMSKVRQSQNNRLLSLSRLKSSWQSISAVAACLVIAIGVTKQIGSAKKSNAESSTPLAAASPANEIEALPRQVSEFAPEERGVMQGDMQDDEVAIDEEKAIWEVYVSNFDYFNEALTSYLQTQRIQYEIDKNSYRIELNDNINQLENWLISQNVIVEKEDIVAGNVLILQVHLSNNGENK